jgi:hypothetical protein
MLCQQLEAEARARMARFEDFIQKDTEQLAREAEGGSDRASVHSCQSNRHASGEGQS